MDRVRHMLLSAMTNTERAAYLAYLTAIDTIRVEIQRTAKIIHSRWADPECRKIQPASPEEYRAACERMDLLYRDLRMVCSRIEALEAEVLARLANDAAPATVAPARRRITDDNSRKHR